MESYGPLTLENFKNRYKLDQEILAKHPEAQDLFTRRVERDKHDTINFIVEGINERFVDQLKRSEIFDDKEISLLSEKFKHATNCDLLTKDII